MATQRLTEEEVHTACADIAAQGERPTALKLLDSLGRGSLTTISKYLNSWNSSEEAQTLDADSLPAVVQLPAELSKDGEDLLKKIWNVAKGIADADLEVQREALKQAEKANQARVEEAFAFSEAQSLKIERLEAGVTVLKEDFDKEFNAHAQTQKLYSDAEKTIIGINKDKEQLSATIESLKEKIGQLEDNNKAAEQVAKALQKNHEDDLKNKDAEIKALNTQVSKLQANLESTTAANEELKTDSETKSAELSKLTVELEKQSVRYEAAVADLTTAKAELKAATKLAGDAEKKVAKLEGQLEVYKTIEKKG